MIPIVFSTDQKFVIPTIVTIQSLLECSSDVAYDIFLLISSDVTAESQELIREQVLYSSPHTKVNFVNMDNHFNYGYEIRGISKACYFRLLIPWLIPQYDKIIYSDVDIIFKDNLKKLFEIDIKDNYIAGVNTIGFQTGRLKKYIIKKNLDPHKYINSGFLIINSRLQREDGLDKILIDMSKKKFLFQDQDILNIVCKDKIFNLPSCYNVSPKQSYDLGINPVVVHYTGPKPWATFTYRWKDWWDIYNGCICYDDTQNLRVSTEILSIKNNMIRLKNSIVYNIKKLLS